MDESPEVLRALIHLVGRDGRDVIELEAGLFTHLTTESLFDGFTRIDTATRQKPRAGVGTADLFHEQDAPSVIGARDDRGETARALAQRES